MSRKISDSRTLWFLTGCLWGAVLMFVGGVLYLRYSLIWTVSLPVPYESFVKEFHGIHEDGWTVRRENCIMPSAPDGTPVSVFKLCKSSYAKRLLSADPASAALLPCSMAVRQENEQKIQISRLNLNLLSRLLGGEYSKLFPDEILPEQSLLLQKTAQKCFKEVSPESK